MGVYKEKILEAMVDYLEKLSAGTETTIGEMIVRFFPEWKELQEETFLSYEPLNDLSRAAKKEGLYLDMSKHDGMVEGLPSALDFAVYQKKDR